MIYMYETIMINNKHYINGSRLLREIGVPSQPYEFSKVFKRNLVDKNGKLQWTIRENPNYNSQTDNINDRYLIENDPIPLTSKETETQRIAAIRSKIVNELPDIILQNKDNPTTLVQVLCNRAKQIEVEI